MKGLSTYYALKVKFHDLRVALGFTVVAILLCMAAYYAYNQFIVSPPYVDPERYPVRGLDVSAHNGMMNLDAAASDGYQFIFIKASEGNTFRDQNFRINYSKAFHAGMKIGAYHYFRFDCDGKSQAKNLLGAIDNRPLDLGVAIDIEEHNNAAGVDSIKIAERLLSMIEYLNMSGHRVTLYSNISGYYDYIKEVVPGACLWICSFSSDPINAEWTYWQYYHHGRVSGIRGDVDLNAFCGSQADWERFLEGAQWPYETI
ncbi:MAG: hypothetical protein K2M31_03135 [Muribaculaceae bacterium]|nr:hypothetical protein [Muribaculaceae bacterium]